MQESGSMESKDDLQKIRIGAVEQLGARPKVLKELQELVPLLAVAYSTDGRTFGYEAPLSMPIPIGSYRHTFLCGQSGSGKTFALGVILERLLLETDLRIVVLDPHSEFVRLDRMLPLADVNRTSSSELSPDIYKGLLKRYRRVAPELKIVRLSPYAKDSSKLLRIRFSDLEKHEQGLVLRMDPLRDREEFNAYWRGIEGLSRESYSLSEVKENVVRQYSEEARKLGLRIENLGVADWSLWCSADEPSLVDVMEEDWRCLVVDSGRLVLSSG
jgi:uncharacterized protein